MCRENTGGGKGGSPRPQTHSRGPARPRPDIDDTALAIASPYRLEPAGAHPIRRDTRRARRVPRRSV